MGDTVALDAWRRHRESDHRRAIGAVLVPLVLWIAWFPRWREAAIGGVALGVLLRVTAAVALVYLVYLAAEGVLRPFGRLRSMPQPTGGRGPGVVGSEVSS